jgi:hypothetical protein
MTRGHRCGSKPGFVGVEHESQSTYNVLHTAARFAGVERNVATGRLLA